MHLHTLSVLVLQSVGEPSSLTVWRASTFLCAYMYGIVGHDFFESLQKHYLENPDGKVVDIHHGQVYRALASGDGPLVDKRNISVVLNTDGVPVFQSTNYQIWPVLLMINELPFAERYAHL